MDLSNPNFYHHSPSLPTYHTEPSLESNASFKNQNSGNPFEETFHECKLNLKETSEFFQTFPMANNNNIESKRGFVEVAAMKGREKRIEPPSTPGRPVFRFSVSNLARKSFPSKWDNAEKWLISSSCNDSPVHAFKPVLVSESPNGLRDDEGKLVGLAEKCGLIGGKVSSFQNCASFDLDQHYSPDRGFNGVLTSGSDMLLKDKFTNNVEQTYPKFGYSNPTKKGFVFDNSSSESMKYSSMTAVQKAQHRDFGTGMSPLGSSKTSRSHTPLKFTSPPRHNTPLDRSGALAVVSTNGTNAAIDISQLQECHLAKLNLGSQYGSVTSNWSSKEEEEEEVSKSLRHFEESDGRKGNFTESMVANKWDWDEDEKIKHCLRYQREEAKIQAWMNLESAKAEAQSRKLEVKIQKMRSNLEEKLIKKMAIVHRKAEEWRAEAQVEHAKQIDKDIKQAEKKMIMNNKHNSYLSPYTPCGCFPCNNHHY